MSITPEELLGDDELRALSLQRLLEVRGRVLADVALIEGQLGTRGAEAKLVPFAPAGPPPERAWYSAARKALAHKRAFLARLAPLVHRRTQEQCLVKPDTRTAFAILEDLRAALADYSFDGDPRVAGLLAEARALSDRRYERVERSSTGRVATGAERKGD